jgi:hypothetical protein
MNAHCDKPHNRMGGGAPANRRRGLPSYPAMGSSQFADALLAQVLTMQDAAASMSRITRRPSASAGYSHRSPSSAA